MGKDYDRRCEHGLRRPCETCDPFVFSRWIRERYSELTKQWSIDSLSPSKPGSPELDREEN